MRNAEFGQESKAEELSENQRGVALIIVLLVTALLIALIFEFAYGTRISLRAAANYRDSQRAYFLARSGVFLFGRFKDLPELAGILPRQGEWAENPLVPGHSFRWEDEGGKLDVHQVINDKNNVAFTRLSRLFTIRGIDQSTLDAMSDWQSAEQRTFYLLTELHMFLNDEEFQAVQDALTMVTVPAVNINTASADVLQSIGLDPFMAKKIVERRDDQPFKATQDITDWLISEGVPPDVRVAVVSSLTTTGNVFKVDSVAKVGGYTKQVEAIITKGTGSSVTVNYWREF